MTFMWWTKHKKFRLLLLHHILYNYVSLVNPQFILLFILFCYLLLYLLLSSESCLKMEKLNPIWPIRSFQEDG